MCLLCVFLYALTTFKMSDNGYSLFDIIVKPLTLIKCKVLDVKRNWMHVS